MPGRFPFWWSAPEVRRGQRRGGTVDSAFWWGILGGIVVSFLVGLPLSFVANIYTTSVTERISRWQSRKKEKSRQNAHAAYRKIAALRGDTIERLSYFQGRMFLITMQFLASLMMLISPIGIHVALVHSAVRANGGKQVEPLPDSILELASWIPVVFLVLAVISFLLVVRRINDLSTMRWRVEHFDEFKKQITEQWGDPEIAELVGD